MSEQERRLVAVTTDQRGIAAVTLDRTEARNALCRPLVAQLDAALDRLDADPLVRVLVLRGAGGNFAAGADLREMLPMTAAQVLLDDFAGCSRRLAHMKKPVVAAVEGWALGGGCELVEMCDLVIAADTARFGHPEVTVGTMPGAGGTQRLINALGKAKALDLLLTGRTMMAEEAERCGFVSRIVPADRLQVEAMEVAGRIASFSAPLVRMLKEAARHAQRTASETGLAHERRLFQLTFALDDRREGMAAFLEKRPPLYRDR